MGLKKIELYEGHSFFSSPSWICGLEDNEELPLGFYLEVTDMYEATGEEEFKQYPFLFSISILPVNCDIEYSKDAGLSDEELEGVDHAYLSDVYSYMGGVPVDHKFLSTDRLNKDLMNQLKIGQAMLVTSNPEYGTVAAQEGPGAELIYPRFKDEDDCQNFAESLIEAYGDALMMMIGFTLDAPINMAGHDGWSVIKSAVDKGV